MLMQHISTPALAAPASKVWTQIVSRTDEIYSQNEQGYGLVKGMLDKLVFEMDDVTLSIAPLKDPIRIHEKALSKYANKFDDGVLAEACVLDVIRAKCSASTGDSLFGLLTKLHSIKFPKFCGTVHEKECSVELVRCKNKFAHPDPYVCFLPL